MRARKYDYELIVQVKANDDRPSGWESIEAVQTDSTYYYDLDYKAPESQGNHKRAAKTARYLRDESALAYGAGFSFRIIRRRTKKGAQA